VSATTLEGAAACPFRHFLERGLGVEAIEDVKPDPDRWLDPLTRGSLLHELYAIILREARAAGQRASRRQHGARLRALGEERLAAHRALVPPPSDGVFAREREEILRDLELFLELCEQEGDCEPVGFEVSFGGGPGEGEPLAQSEPVTIAPAADVRFLLRGRIDRIDRLRDGTYEVIDYKTGRWWAPDWEGTVRGGRLLQHALYGLAATALLRRRDPRAHVSRSTYYLPTVRGQAERVVFPPLPPGRLAAVLGDLLDVLATGTFVHTPEKSDCAFCEMGAACGTAPFERARRKLGDSALAAFQRLRAHE
jgi:ATP-dependent helicase/nuclease subunit B